MNGFVITDAFSNSFHLSFSEKISEDLESFIKQTNGKITLLEQKVNNQELQITLLKVILQNRLSLTNNLFQSENNRLEDILVTKEMQTDVKFLMMEYSKFSDRLAKIESMFSEENQQTEIIKIENLQFHGITFNNAKSILMRFQALADILDRPSIAETKSMSKDQKVLNDELDKKIKSISVQNEQIDDEITQIRTLLAAHSLELDLINVSFHFFAKY